MHKGLHIIALLAGIILLGIQIAVADVTVVYKISQANGGGSQTILYADKQHIRLDMNGAGNQHMSLLKLGGKTYSINGKVVQDLSQLAKMMASMGMAKKSGHQASEPIIFKDTGKTETIAGIHGKVFRFADNGKSHEVVLGQNKNLQDAVLGMINIMKDATVMLPSDATDRIQQNATIQSMAILRLDNQMRLQSIDTGTLPADTFKLPSKPQQMGSMGGLMKGFLEK